MHFARIYPENRIPIPRQRPISDVQIMDQMRPFLKDRLMIVYGCGQHVPIYDENELAVVARMVSRYYQSDDSEVLRDSFYANSLWNSYLLPTHTDGSLIPSDSDQVEGTPMKVIDDIMQDIDTHRNAIGSSKSNPIFIRP